MNSLLNSTDFDNFYIIIMWNYESLSHYCILLKYYKYYIFINYVNYLTNENSKI